jgi:hypothetical protein
MGVDGGPMLFHLSSLTKGQARSSLTPRRAAAVPEVANQIGNDNAKHRSSCAPDRAPNTSWPVAVHPARAFPKPIASF